MTLADFAKTNCIHSNREPNGAPVECGALLPCAKHGSPPPIGTTTPVTSWTPTACPHHRLDDPAGLTCQRLDEHTTGHVYHSASGVPDRHDLPGRGDGE